MRFCSQLDVDASFAAAWVAGGCFTDREYNVHLDGTPHLPKTDIKHAKDAPKFDDNGIAQLLPSILDLPFQWLECEARTVQLSHLDPATRERIRAWKAEHSEAAQAKAKRAELRALLREETEHEREQRRVERQARRVERERRREAERIERTINCAVHNRTGFRVSRSEWLAPTTLKVEMVSPNHGYRTFTLDGVGSDMGLVNDIHNLHLHLAAINMDNQGKRP